MVAVLSNLIIKVKDKCLAVTAIISGLKAKVNNLHGCGPAKVFPKLNKTPPLQETKKYQNCTVPQRNQVISALHLPSGDNLLMHYFVNL